MRVLIASKRRPGALGRQDGGVQTWVRTVALKLVAMGHSPMIGDASVRPTGQYDLGILQNLKYTERFADQCRRVVTICHGIVEDERPVRGSWFTSEGVRDHWKQDGPIVRQPIDLEFWHPGIAKRRYLTRFSHRWGLEFMPELAARMGLDFYHVHRASPEQAREILQASVCVLASGRAALEAMACGAPVVICDHRNYQGPLLDPDTTGAMARNYSGRGGFEPTPEIVEAQVKRAIQAGSLREHVEEHHDAAAIVRQLLS